MIATSSVPDVLVGRRDEPAFFREQFAYVRSSGAARYVLPADTIAAAARDRFGRLAAFLARIVHDGVAPGGAWHAVRIDGKRTPAYANAYR